MPLFRNSSGFSRGASMYRGVTRLCHKHHFSNKSPSFSAFYLAAFIINPVMPSEMRGTPSSAWCLFHTLSLSPSLKLAIFSSCLVVFFAGITNTEGGKLELGELPATRTCTWALLVSSFSHENSQCTQLQFPSEQSMLS